MGVLEGVKRALTNIAALMLLWAWGVTALIYLVVTWPVRHKWPHYYDDARTNWAQFKHCVRWWWW